MSDGVKFTPGPWATEPVNHEFLEHDIICDYKIPDAGFPTLLATVFFDEDYGGFPISQKQATANAKLIAAAPDLYSAALKAEPIVAAMCNALGETCPPGDAEALFALRAALKKANGA